MITKEQLLTALLQYADNELLPALPTSGKWIVGTFITLASSQWDNYFRKFSDNQIVSALGIIQQNGMIDYAAALNALRTNAEKYGKLQLSLPLIGSLYFSASDVDKLKQYIERSQTI